MHQWCSNPLCLWSSNQDNRAKRRERLRERSIMGDLSLFLFQFILHKDVCSAGWLFFFVLAWWYKYLLTGVWPVALSYRLRCTVYRMFCINFIVFFSSAHIILAHPLEARGRCAASAPIFPCRKRSVWSKVTGEEVRVSHSLFSTLWIGACSFGPWAHRKLRLASRILTSLQNRMVACRQNDFCIFFSFLF